MIQRFFTTTLISDFIKNLISKTPLPLINTVNDLDYVVANCFYIYKDIIIKVTESGKLHSDTDAAVYTKISNYEFGKYYPKFTEYYVSKSRQYDSDTHYYLGQYLRCIRDIYDIDLLPFYNCFTYKPTTGFYLNDTANGSDNTKNQITLTTLEAPYKIVAVPIKFNKTYTIAVSSKASVLIRPIFYNETGLMLDLTQAFPTTTAKYLSTDFNKPFTCKVPLEEEYSGLQPELQRKFQSKEKYLKLIIQLPKSNNSSIVVLEGDYTSFNNNFYDVTAKQELTVNFSEITDLNNQDLNNLLLTSPKLLAINDSISYPFSDRLIEYLLSNVITDLDEFDIDIAKVNFLLDPSTNNKKVWSNKLRLIAYMKAIQAADKLYDINGYIDRDVDQIINLDKTVSYPIDTLFKNWLEGSKQ